MSETFTKNELIFFKIVGWAIAIFIPLVLYRWNSKELKKSEKSQGKRIDDLWKKLQKETKDRIELEKKIVEENAKEWESLYRQEKENSKQLHKNYEGTWEKYSKLLEESGEEKNKLKQDITNLRLQLLRKGVSWSEHDINDEKRKEEAIFFVKARWELNQNKNGKINGWTITEVLGENWENNFKNKEGEDIAKARDWLAKKIDNEINQPVIK